MRGFRKCMALAATIAAAVGMTAGAWAKTELTVYTAYENDDLAAYKEAFEAKHPDIVINWVRDSTGVVAAKLLAEKDNPRADAVWGLAVTNIDVLRSRGVLQPYRPAGFEKIPEKFRDPADPPYCGLVTRPGFAPSFTTRSKARSATFHLPRPGAT